MAQGLEVRPPPEERIGLAGVRRDVVYVGCRGWLFALAAEWIATKERDPQCAPTMVVAARCGVAAIALVLGFRL